MNEVVDRVTCNNSSSSDLFRLPFVCCRPSLLSSTTSSVVFVRALYVYPVVVRQRLVRQLVSLSRCRCWERRPSSPTFVEDTVLRGRRRSARSLGKSNLVIFVVVVVVVVVVGFYVGAALSCRSSFTTTRPLRHRPLRRSFVVACVRTHSTRCVRTLVVSRRSSVDWVLTNLRKVL